MVQPGDGAGGDDHGLRGNKRIPSITSNVTQSLAPSSDLAAHYQGPSVRASPSDAEAGGSLHPEITNLGIGIGPTGIEDRDRQIIDLLHRGGADS